MLTSWEDAWWEMRNWCCGSWSRVRTPFTELNQHIKENVTTSFSVTKLWQIVAYKGIQCEAVCRNFWSCPWMMSLQLLSVHNHNTIDFSCLTYMLLRHHLRCCQFFSLPIPLWPSGNYASVGSSSPCSKVPTFSVDVPPIPSPSLPSH